MNWHKLADLRIISALFQPTGSIKSMWFKNLCLYRLTKPLELSAEELHEKLSERIFHPIGKLEPAFTGWSEPLGDEGSQLVHSSGACIMICTRKEEKILPAAAVRELLDARAQEIEDKEGRKVRGKEKQRLKDEVLLDMMPRAFSKSSRNYAYIDTRHGWLIVDSANLNRAEEFISLLRETLGSFPVVPITVASAPDAIMTDWLTRNTAPADISIDDEVELRDPEQDGGIVRIRRQDLGSDEISVHLEAGKRVTQLALTFDDRISFVMNDQLQLKRIRFTDTVLDETEDTDTAAERFDADFALMSLEFSRFIPRLLEIFGGLADDA